MHSSSTSDAEEKKKYNKKYNFLDKDKSLPMEEEEEENRRQIFYNNNI